MSTTENKLLELIAKFSIDFRYRTNDSTWSEKRESTLAKLAARVIEKRPPSSKPRVEVETSFFQADNVALPQRPTSSRKHPIGSNEIRPNSRQRKLRYDKSTAVKHSKNQRLKVVNKTAGNQVPLHDRRKHELKSCSSLQKKQRACIKRPQSKSPKRKVPKLVPRHTVTTQSTGCKPSSALRPILANRISKSKQSKLGALVGMMSNKQTNKRKPSSETTASRPKSEPVLSPGHATHHRPKSPESHNGPSHIATFTLDQMDATERLFNNLICRNGSSLPDGGLNVDDGSLSLSQVEGAFIGRLPGEPNRYLVERIFAVLCNGGESAPHTDDFHSLRVTFVKFCRFLAICTHGELSQRLKLCFHILDKDGDGVLSQTDLFALLKWNFHKSIPNEADFLTAWVRHETMTLQDLEREVSNVKQNQLIMENKHDTRSAYPTSAPESSSLESFDFKLWESELRLSMEQFCVQWPRRKSLSLIDHILASLSLEGPVKSPGVSKERSKFAGVLGVSKAKRGLMKLRRKGVGLPKRQCNAAEFLKTFATRTLLSDIGLSFSQAEHLTTHFIRFTKGSLCETCKVKDIVNFLEYRSTSKFGIEVCGNLVRDAAMQGFAKSGKDLDKITLASFLTTLAIAKHGKDSKRASLAFAMYSDRAKQDQSDTVQLRPTNRISSARLESLFNDNLGRVVPEEESVLLDLAFNKVTSTNDSDITFEEFCFAMAGPSVATQGANDRLQECDVEVDSGEQTNSTQQASGKDRFQLLLALWDSFGLN